MPPFSFPQPAGLLRELQADDAQGDAAERLIGPLRVVRVEC